MIDRKLRKGLAYYAKWIVHHRLNLADGPDAVRRYVVDGNPTRKQPITGPALEYVVSAVAREQRLELRRLRSFGL